MRARSVADTTISSSTRDTKQLEDKFAWVSQRLQREGQPVAEGGWAQRDACGTSIFIFDVGNTELKVAGTTVKAALSTEKGLHEMCVDLVDIYFWFIHPPDLSFLPSRRQAAAREAAREAEEEEAGGRKRARVANVGASASAAPAEAAAAAAGRAPAAATINLKVALVTAHKDTSFTLSQWGRKGAHGEAAAATAAPAPFELSVQRAIRAIRPLVPKAASIEPVDLVCHP